MLNTGAYALKTLPHSIRNCLQVAGLVCLLSGLSACSRMDYSLNKHNLNPHTAQGTQVAAFSFSFDAMRDPYEVPLRRVSGGYALQAPLYHGENTVANMEISKTSDHSWCFGPKFSFTF